MKNSEDIAWARKVGNVFNAMPRDGSQSTVIWQTRKKEEGKVDSALLAPGVNVCIDGPSGTGKTSLALTMLSRLKFRRISVQFTDSMDWTEFCKCALRNFSATERMPSVAAVDIEAEIGLNPSLKIKKASQTTSAPANLEDRAKSCSEHDLIRMLADRGAILCIDDFEKASSDMLKRVADLCKLASTHRHHGVAVKILIIGTDDIFLRIRSADRSLEGRIEEISLGGMADKLDSWQFLCRGWDALGLRHPGNDKLTKSRDIAASVKSVYEAADGLPKSLNALGRLIAKEGVGRSRVSAADIRRCSYNTVIEDARAHRRTFREIVTCYLRNPATRQVVNLLYERGIGRIHSVDEFCISLEYIHPSEQTENAINELVDAKLLVRTGDSSDVLWVTELSVAHLLGVISSNPETYRPDDLQFGQKHVQYLLPFLGGQKSD